MSDANFSERAGAPISSRSEHGVDLPFEVRSPPVGGVEGGVEVGFEIEGGEERRVLAGVEPGLADKHGSGPSVVEGESGENVDKTLVSQLRPVRVEPRLGLASLIIH